MALRRLEKYEILEEVGQGGMARVFRGYDTTLGREVAVKILHPHLADQPESKRRLQREAQAVAKLRHENILEIFDYSGPDAAESFIVTEYIHGPTLRQFLDQKGVPYPEIGAMIVAEVCRALSHAHRSGIIHRDIKPENVMIRDDGMIKLTDFGIAQIVDKERMTVTGQLLGSPAYMAPEHVQGKALDFRTDVFSVGILLYQLATGELPFKGKNPHEVLKRIAEGRYIDARVVRPQIGERLGRILLRALERVPSARYPDTGPLLSDLLEYLAEIDIADPRAELARFFAAPEAYAKAFEPRLVDTLVRKAEEATAAGRRAMALELLSRALTLRPRHAQAAVMLRRLSRRRRFGLALGLGAAAAVVFAGAAGLRHHLRAAVPAQAAPALGPSASPVGEPPTPKATAPEPPPREPARKEPPVRDPSRRVAETEARRSPGRSRSVRIEAIPKAVMLSLDGRAIPFDDAHPVIEVPTAGRHRLRFENPACYPEEKEITSDEVIVHLRWRPARIRIETTPAEAIVVSRGRPVRGGLIEQAVEGASREVAIEVEAQAAGYALRRTTCRGLAGEEKVCRIALEKVE